MKWLIASDIHGSAYWCEKLLEAYKRENAERLLLLGDVLYHGPRNDLPFGYDPKAVIAMLNPLASEIICVRGNCESEVDGMVLDFPVGADYAIISEEALGSRIIFATHGHLFNEENPPLLKNGDFLLNGHFHNPCIRQTEQGFVYANCGSVSLPKEGTPHSYLLYENGTLYLKDLQSGGIFDCIDL